MKFWKIFNYECRYQLRNASVWLLSGLLFLFGFLVLRLVQLSDGTFLNAPGTIAFFAIFGSTIWMLIGGGVAGDAATRDIESGIHPLTYTCPVSKINYLGARFLAALALNILILVTMYAGMLFSFYAPGVNAQFIGPFRIATYLTAYAFITLPVVLAGTAIQFTCAIYSKRAIAAFIGSILLLFISQFLGTTIRYALGWEVFGSLLDLMGFGIAADMEGWTPIEKNTRLVSLSGIQVWNRLMWFGISICALVFTYFHFQLAHIGSIKRWRLFGKKKRSLNELVRNSETSEQNKEISKIHYPSITRDFTLVTYLRQVLAITWASFTMIVLGRGGLILIAILSIGTGLFASEYMQYLGVPLLARTEEVLSVLTPSLNSFNSQWILIPILIIFYTGELIWRERDARINELSDTSPVPEWAMLLGKFLGLGLIIATWVLFLMMSGMINQLVMDYNHFEPWVYIKVLFGIQLTNYLLFAILVFVLHVILNQKYIGHMVAFCAYGLIIFASRLGLEHKMLIYASDPGWSYGDMRGFGSFLEPWLWFKLYWGSWAFLFGVIASLFWVRSKDKSFKSRLVLAQSRISRYKTPLTAALILLAVTSGFVFYNTNILNDYQNSGERMAINARYEKRYGKYLHEPQPIIQRTKLNIELYPDQAAADIRGSYYLVNTSRMPIKSIHLSSIPQQPLIAVSFDKQFSSVVADNHHGYRIFSLKNELKQGDSLRMDFRIKMASHGFSNNGKDIPVAANGTHITSNLLPKIGYYDSREIREAADRKHYGLAPRPERTSLYDTIARRNINHALNMDFEAIIGTSKDQIAVAPGNLNRTWVKGGRKYFHYATDAPIKNSYALFSARYATRELLWVPSLSKSDNIKASSNLHGPRAVKVQIFYHPTHDTNIGRMVKSVRASLDYYSHEFGPYPYKNFRVVERPGPGRGMHAEPMVIDYPEGYSLMNPKPEGLDLPYHIMAHEVAHQWWGFQLAPAAVEGLGLLVESLATYSAMQVVEKNLGQEHLIRYLSQMRLEYEVPRSPAAPPLLQANSAYMSYRKGPFALYALRNYIGQEKVNDALRTMLRKYSSKPPLPTTIDFFRELKSVTPDSLHYLVHDLFAANTFWKMETKSVTAKQMMPGKWQVTLESEARKETVDSIGNTTNVPMNDWLEIGVYGDRIKGGSNEVLYLKKHRVGTGKNTFILNVSKKPVRAGIDPSHLLMDMELDNNTKEVEVRHP